MNICLNSDEPFSEDEQKYKYESPKHSDSFLEHLNNVKSAWPFEQTSVNSADDNETANYAEPSESSSYSVFCTGEPAIDPSREVRIILDGEPDWI